MWNPYEWHTETKHGRTFEWRVKDAMHEKRLELLNQLDELSKTELNTFKSVDRWHELKAAVLACEEVKGGRNE